MKEKLYIPNKKIIQLQMISMNNKLIFFSYIYFTKNIDFIIILFLLPTVFELVKIIVTKMNAVGNNESEETPLLIYNFIFYY